MLRRLESFEHPLSYSISVRTSRPPSCAVTMAASRRHPCCHVISSRARAKSTGNAGVPTRARLGVRSTIVATFRAESRVRDWRDLNL